MPRKEAKGSKTTPKKHSPAPVAVARSKATAPRPATKKVMVQGVAAAKATTPFVPILKPVTPDIARVVADSPAGAARHQEASSAATAVAASSTVVENSSRSQSFDCSRAEVTAIEPAMAHDISTFLSDLKSPIAYVRERAAGELGRSDNPAACEPLIDALNDSDADVAREAAVALGVLGVSTAACALSQLLRNADGYHHAVVRAASAASLGALRDAGAIESLVNAVYDAQAEVSAEATRSLGQFGSDDRAIDALIDVVRNHNGYFLPVVRRAALLALGRSDAERARAEVRYVANDLNEDYVIRTDAARLSYSA